MRIPRTPPPFTELLSQAAGSPDDMAKLLSGQNSSPTVGGRYVHWDKLRFLPPPEGLTVEQHWTAIKFARVSLMRSLPLLDKHGDPFEIAVPDPLQRQLSEVDRDLSGRVGVPAQLNTPGVRDSYLVSALIEEAITSSQLEGAATTRKVAKEMLRSGRRPRTHDERMIVNNFQAMEFVRSIAEEPLTPELVLRIHRYVSEDTLEDPEDAGRLRTEEVCVHAPDGTRVHEAPPAHELAERLEACCAFANDVDGEPFLHPIVRATLVHFCIGYDHPFIDGNGRTARALFYWAMLRAGYSLCEFLSISRILRAAPAKYMRAYLYTETDDQDTTYFVLYQMDVLQRAIRALHEYIVAKAGTLQRTQQIMRSSPELNYRQVALLSHALANPDALYGVTAHARSHGVTRQTARTDLKALADHQLLSSIRRGRSFLFGVPADLEERLREFGA